MTINHQLIPVKQATRWTEALQGIAHPYAHRWEYCAAMANSSGLETFLYVGEEAGYKVICPLSVRKREDGYSELVSPYGFGGIIATHSTGKLHGLRAEWANFAQEKGFVTAYIMQHPAFPLSQEMWDEDLHEYHILYLVDLTIDIDKIWQEMGKTHRYEIRRMGREPTFQLVTDREKLAEAMLGLYPETMERVSASEVYHFSAATLKQLAKAPGTLLLGVEEGARVQAVVLFLYTPWIAEYFLNATSSQGRKYTRLLMWTAIKALKRLGVTSLNLGGGVHPGDSLDHFKRRFGGRMVRGQVLKQIFDQEKYTYLCSKYYSTNHCEISYFPPYWSDRVE